MSPCHTLRKQISAARRLPEPTVRQVYANTLLHSLRIAMAPSSDVEAVGEKYYSDEFEHSESQALLAEPSKANEPSSPIASDSDTCRVCWPSKARFSSIHLYISFVLGIVLCILTQFASCGGPNCLALRPNVGEHHKPRPVASAFAEPWAGSTTRHPYPPPSPTNAFPSLFPTDVGYAGGTPTGGEAALVETAPSYPIQTATPQLVAAPSLVNATKGKDPEFDLLKKWGNLSPWFSVPRGAYGIESGPETPTGCEVTGLHLLHRHGARYPTNYASYGGPANFASRLHSTASSWNASGDLEFLNNWTYKLGEEVLTPFGRQQLFDLGVSMRLKYGFLLEEFTKTNTLPVFRTESQDRMLKSAQNFAAGFFGIPFEDMYQQSVTIEAAGFNNTLAPYMVCPNSQDRSKSDRGRYYVSSWADVYLANARDRLQRQITGYELSIEDTYIFQQTCAYETVALGFSKFCELFTEEEWDGFEYSLDLYFWYDSAFGAPLAKSMGVGYVHELVARLTHTPIAVHNTSTNATLDDDERTFPLNQSLYVDATHEVVILYVLTALGLDNFASEGPLPYTHIPENRPFRVSYLAPFSSNVQFQLLSCSSKPSPQLRVLINDGVSPLSSLPGCGEDPDGLCDVDSFIEAQKTQIRETDFAWGCEGDWSVPEGEAWETVKGEPPAKP